MSFTKVKDKVNLNELYLSFSLGLPYGPEF